MNGADSSFPEWGDFGGICLVGACRISPDLFMPGSRILGLEKAGSYLLGTWRTEDGEIYRLLRTLGNYDSNFGCSVFSTEGSDRLSRLGDDKAPVYRGGLSTQAFGDRVQIASHDGSVFRHNIDVNTASWDEGTFLSCSGDLIAPATNWFNPWRTGGGGYAITAKFRGKATVFGKEAEGFFAHESHFFPAGMDFMASPYGLGGREIHWGHMATVFEDGSVIDASLAYGADGWGFAMLTDENGRFYATNEIEIGANVRPNGYPELITYRFLDQTWCWRIDPKGERDDVMPGGVIGAEGVLIRANETRRVKGAMGTIDWWKDGRDLEVPPAVL